MPIDLNNITEETLLNKRLSELPIQIKDTWLDACVTELHKELEAKGLCFRPPCYLADEWLTPDRIPIIGIPFYLAHPTLIKLEKKMMLEAEGETKEWCMKLLRHEAGHAINYAYKLFKKRSWQKTFGKFTTEYEEGYRFRPYSRSFVRHLEDYYAQYHPDEDFAETFAVWLTPDSNWQEKYKGWKAMAKLKYVDSLMQEINAKEPLVKDNKEYWKASAIRRTLKYHYKKKQDHHAEDFPHFHDANLLRIFSKRDNTNKKQPSAAKTIRKYRKTILQSLSRWTGEKKYVANDLFNNLLARCRELDLVCIESETEILLRTSTYMTTLLMNYMYTGKLRGEK